MYNRELYCHIKVISIDCVSSRAYTHALRTLRHVCCEIYTPLSKLYFQVANPPTNLRLYILYIYIYEGLELITRLSIDCSRYL